VPCSAPCLLPLSWGGMLHRARGCCSIALCGLLKLTLERPVSCRSAACARSLLCIHQLFIHVQCHAYDWYLQVGAVLICGAVPFDWAGLHPDDQAAGNRLPSFNSAPPPAAATGPTGHPQQYGLGQINSAPASLQAAPTAERVPSSSNMAPYPSGSAAAAAHASANDWVQGK